MTAQNKDTAATAPEEEEAVAAVVALAPDEAEKAEVNEELARIDPKPGFVTLSSGTEAKLEPLKTRQFFKLLRIVTHGGSHMLGNLNLSSGDDEGFVTQLLALVIFAVPDAEDEAIEFVQSMLSPVTAQPKPEDYAALYAELDNPELDDLVTVIEAVVRRDGADMKALGKRLMTMFQLAQKTGQV